MKTDDIIKRLDKLINDPTISESVKEDLKKVRLKIQRASTREEFIKAVELLAAVAGIAQFVISVV
jgi:hypothetical protein